MILLTFGLVVGCCCGCAPKITVKPKIVEIGEDQFSSAERLFQERSYEKALEKYQAYLSRYPDSPLLPAALMKIGEIYSGQGNYEKARNIYEKLMHQHPKSGFAADAGVAVLVILLKEGKYIELIKKSGRLPQKPVSRIHILRISMLVGDSFAALGSPLDAAYSYIMAHHRANDIEKGIIEEKIRDSLLQLDTVDVRNLIARLKDPQDIKLVETIHQMTLFRMDTIGCLLPLSGPYKKFGYRALKGIELALNRFGSPKERSFKIIVKDTESNPDKAAHCIQELFDEKAACIIGPMITALPAAKAAQERQIPIVALSHRDNITETGDYVFRNFITPEMQVKTLVSYAVRNLKANRFAILYPREKYGTTFMNLFWDEVIENEGEVVGVEAYDLDQMDFAAPVKKLIGLFYEVPEDLKFTMVERFGEEKEKTGQSVFTDHQIMVGSVYYNWIEDLKFISLLKANEKRDELKEEEEKPEPIIDFDVIFLPDSPKKAGLIIPQLAYYDVENVFLFGSNLWHSDELIKMARPYVQGAIMTEGFFENSDSKRVTEFMAAFLNSYNEKPGFIEAVAYDTAGLLFKTLSRPDIQLRSEIKDALLDLNYLEGVTGRTTFNKNGEAEKQLYLLKIRGDRFVELKH